MNTVVTENSQLKLDLDSEPGIALLTLDRQPAYNALDIAMLEQLPALLQGIAENDELRCVVLTGAGDKAFCAGGDISGMDSGVGITDVDVLANSIESWAQASRILHEMPKPTIAAVNGVCAGAGMSLALACDMRSASSNATFTTAFAKLAMSGDFGGTYFLSKLVGTAKARELYFLSDKITAEQAAEMHIVNWVTEPGLLMDTTLEISRRLAALPLLTLTNMKRNLNVALEESLPNLLRQESVAMAETASSEETKAAAARFFSGK